MKVWLFSIRKSYQKTYDNTMAKEKVIRRRKTIQWLKKKLSEDVRQYNGQRQSYQKT
jgi:hypothetical protein